MKTLELPVSLNLNQTENIVECNKSIVIVGANGSGKSRLGTWIEFESNQKELVHRISAQKSLMMPEDIRPISVEKSKTMLHYGYYNDKNHNQDYWQFKVGQRWKSSPATFLLDDYNHLMTYLFSDNYEQAIDYKNESMESTERIEPPVTLLDKVVKIWETVIPHRKLKIGSSSISTSMAENQEVIYKSREMSDGERVVFYLIGECISAPQNGIIVIDEPELHIHKTIQRRLWNEIEKTRQDCLFVYLTHDLDFAATRIGSRVIQMKSFNGNKFDWNVIESIEGIADDLLYEIIGSRVPILFVEGEQGSHDTELYSIIYEGFTVKCLGSCKKVIEATKSFRRNLEFHNIACYGIVDRDYMTEEQIKAYEDDGVFCPKVSEVENIFIVEELLLEVAKALYIPEPESKVEEIKKWVIEEFSKLKEVYATEATSASIDYKLNSFDGGANNIENLKAKFDLLNSEIIIDNIYEEKLNHANQLIDEQDYNGIILVFNHKAIVNQIGKFYDIKPSLYVSKIKDILDYGNNSILEVLKSYLPSLG